jgi:hypothetical protein
LLLRWVVRHRKTVGIARTRKQFGDLLRGAEAPPGRGRFLGQFEGEAEEGEYRPNKRPFPQLSRISSGRQAAVNLPATRYRPEFQPPKPGIGPQANAIFGGELTKLGSDWTEEPVETNERSQKAAPDRKKASA